MGKKTAVLVRDTTVSTNPDTQVLLAAGQGLFTWAPAPWTVLEGP